MEEIDFKNGAEVDVRPEEEKIKDFQLLELVSAPEPVNWVEKEVNEWRTFPEQDQDGSGSCVAQTVKKLAGINMFLKEGKYVDFSATSIYQERNNKPKDGMSGVDAFEIWRKMGISLEVLVPSQKMNDAQMDALVVEKYEKDIAKIFSISNHVGLTSGNIDEVASTIQKTGKGVMVWFFFESKEWAQIMPEIQNTALTIQTGLRHSVTAVDYFLHNGEKCLLIEDSAHFGKISRRIITEKFFKARNWFARYGTTFKFEDSSMMEKPRYLFTKDMNFSPVVVKSVDVMILQDCLKYEGFFPANAESTGYYGAVTARAVLAFQKKYKVAPDAELESLQGRSVGPKTRTVLNELFA